MTEKIEEFLLQNGFNKRLVGEEWYKPAANGKGEFVYTKDGIMLFHFYECYCDFLNVDGIALTLDTYKNKLDQLELGL